jgi:very-short-patch-repair endonuclease
MKIYYSKNLKSKSRKLRKNSTLAEVLLWNQLKSRKLLGYQFMHQKPIGKYIVDFYCSKLKLVLEIDGSSHTDLDKDKMRQDELTGLGLRFLRILDWDVKTNLNNVIEYIKSQMLEIESSV